MRRFACIAFCIGLCAAPVLLRVCKQVHVLQRHCCVHGLLHIQMPFCFFPCAMLSIAVLACISAALFMLTLLFKAFALTCLLGFCWTAVHLIGCHAWPYLLMRTLFPDALHAAVLIF